MKARYATVNKIIPPAPVLKENFISVQNFKDNVVLTNDTLIRMYPKINPNFISEEEISKLNFTSPAVFGPPLWFTMHNASMHYPDAPSPLVVEKMKNFIIAIPILLPCDSCREHAVTYIDEHFDEIEEACKSKTTLFKFFVDFHNYVNVRLNKPVMSYEDAYKLYSDF